MRFLSLTGNSRAEREEISRQINYWVQLFTQGVLQQVITAEQIDPDANLILTSAINFNASWKRPFLESRTGFQFFIGLDGSDDTGVLMMDQQNYFRYYEEHDYTAVELMYAGDDLSMLILVPHEGHFRQVEARINADLINTILSDMGEEIIIKLLMPRWETASNNDMGDVLRSLGLNDLFTAGVADLSVSGINGTRNLSLGLLAQSAVVTVDEDGTRAAAATTAINVGGLNNPVPVIELNRQFIYIIIDVNTGVVLFMGRMATP